MRARGQFPTQHTAGAFLDALKLDGRVDRCVAVYDEMVDGDVNLGCVCFNIVVSTLVQVKRWLPWDPTTRQLMLVTCEQQVSRTASYTAAVFCGR